MIEGFFNDPTVRAAAVALFVALCVYFTAVLQRMASRVVSIQRDAKTNCAVLADVAKTTSQLETQGNGQRAALERKIELLEARLDAHAQKATAVHEAEIDAKDRQIALLSERPSVGSGTTPKQ